MNHITAIGFDLINTLVVIQPRTLEVSLHRLTQSLQKSGFSIDNIAFYEAYKKAIHRSMERIRQDGKETHNRFWIHDALSDQGYDVSPYDRRIARAVEAYFSAFYENCDLIPGTHDMLITLKTRYKLGLLSNFTHAPAAKKIITQTGLTGFFDVIVISGNVGFRKPHPSVFDLLVKHFETRKERIVFIGDDLETDMMGARQAGLQPIWSTYVQNHRIRTAPPIIHGDVETPDFEGPRISTWDDLLSFLDGQRYKK